ncbi:MAG: hypothetical protein LBV20_07040 [Treponema sp.]|nr:hypothetical protein [Treponema sp.]
MTTTILHFELDGKKVLGFDTGLNERSFAQAKASSLVTETGYLVKPDFSIDTWKTEGVITRNKRMIIYGPDFEGLPLNELIQNDADKDEALNALRHWLKAILVLSEKNIIPGASPREAIMAKNGAILFPPPALSQRALNAEEPNAALSASGRYVHPDLHGEDAFAFSAGTMLYQIFSGTAAFSQSDADSVRSGMRAGSFIPVNLRAPGLDENITHIITHAIKMQDDNVSLTNMIEALGTEGSKQYKDFFHAISDDEKKSLLLKQEQYQKRGKAKSDAKKFFLKNKAVIIGAGIGIALIAIIAWNIIAGIKNATNTKDMTPQEIAQHYYASFGTLDHDFMEAATSGKAGKEDIAMVQNLFVISKVRQAYEMIAPVIPAEEWIDAGSPETASIVFGVSDLRLAEITQSDDEVQIEAEYLLWMPANYAGNSETQQEEESEAEAINSQPVSIQYTNTLNFTKRNDAWYIAEIIKQ